MGKWINHKKRIGTRIAAALLAAAIHLVWFAANAPAPVLAAGGTEVRDGMDSVWTSGSCIVPENSEVNIRERIIVRGDVTLTLKKGCTLNALKGITVNEGSSLTIEGDNGDNTGVLNAVSGDERAAGIGGEQSQNCGQIEIRGGTVTARGGNGVYAAGIGGGSGLSGGGSGGTIRISGGIVTAYGGESGASYGAGIGGGARGGSGSVTISGGVVNAYSSDSGFGYGAGIGSGRSGSGGDVTISGGVVNAYSSRSSGSFGSGIGCGRSGEGVRVSVSGGMVTADRSANGSTGYGSGLSGSFSTGKSGSAMVVTSSISDLSDQKSWKAVIFTESGGEIYGADQSVFTLTENTAFSLPENGTLVIDPGQTLAVPENSEVKVPASAVIFCDGSCSGSIEQKPYCRLEVTNGTVSAEDTVKRTDSSGTYPYVRSGSRVVLNAASSDASLRWTETIPEGASPWIGEESANLSSLSLVMPSRAVSVKAESVDTDWTASLSQNSYPYTGEPVMPEVTVTRGKEVLVKDRDFSVTYSEDCTNAGEKTVTVAGMGNYGGETVLKYTVTQAVNSWVTEPSAYGWEEGSEAVPPAGEARFGNVTFTYLDSKSRKLSGAPSSAGSYSVVAEVKETGNYTGLSKRLSFSVTKRESGGDGSSGTEKSVPMFRLYNPNSSEHFYTANETERNHLVSLGWKYEGVGWYAPVQSASPVFRLYNKNGGEHQYTLNKTERDNLILLGWKYEGVGWYSSNQKSVPVYRQYNPNAFSNNHNFTPVRKENDWLVSQGWRYEGVAWYGADAG